MNSKSWSSHLAFGLLKTGLFKFRLHQHTRSGHMFYVSAAFDCQMPLPKKHCLNCECVVVENIQRIIPERIHMKARIYTPPPLPPLPPGFPKLLEPQCSSERTQLSKNRSNLVLLHTCLSYQQNPGSAYRFVPVILEACTWRFPTGDKTRLTLLLLW